MLQGKAGRWHGAKAEGAALLRGRTGQTTSDGSSGEPFGLQLRILPLIKYLKIFV